MKRFNKIFLTALIFIIAVFIGGNLIFSKKEKDSLSKAYIVEISRLSLEIEKNGIDSLDLSKCTYINNVEECIDSSYFAHDEKYAVREINGRLYRFDYVYADKDRSRMRAVMNTSLAFIAFIFLIIMLYVRQKIVLPLEKLKELPYELSKGNLTVTLKKTKNPFFSRFMWGLDLLRENIEEQKKRELELQKEKKTLLLSLSHDIKTPLSAIKLYSRALSKGLYKEHEKQLEIAENMNAKADEIENFVSQIITASREDFLSIEVDNGEFYIIDLITNIKDYYTEKMELIKNELTINDFPNCIVKGDIDRSIEVMQNIIENALKYGDGKGIEVDFSEEEGCILISVSNTGCTLSDSDTVHFFESFWRGENSEKVSGSGLGLYICRRLMHKMNGDIFAKINGDKISVTILFTKA